MHFREQLQGVLSQVDGAVACSIMGFDGIVLQTHPEHLSATDAHLPESWAEYAHALTLVNTASQSIQSGAIWEMSLQAERLQTVMRRINRDYFLVLALKPEANLGKARFIMRMTAPELDRQL